MYLIIRFVLALQLGLMAGHYVWSELAKDSLSTTEQLPEKRLPDHQDKPHAIYSADVDEDQSSLLSSFTLYFDFLRPSERGICTIPSCSPPYRATPEIPPRYLQCEKLH